MQNRYKINQILASDATYATLIEYMNAETGEDYKDFDNKISTKDYMW